MFSCSKFIRAITAVLKYMVSSIAFDFTWNSGDGYKPTSDTIRNSLNVL